MAVSFEYIMAIMFMAFLIIVATALVPICLILCCHAAAEWRRSSQLRRPAATAPQWLVYFSYPAGTDAEGGGRTAGASVVVCAICLEALVGGAECSEVPACRHVFHRGCIALWMKKGKSTCPLCRRPIVPGPEPLSAADAMV